MDNLNQPLEENGQVNSSKASWPLIAVIVVAVIAIGVAWQYTGSNAEPEVVEQPAPEPVSKLEPEKVVEIEQPLNEMVAEEVEEVLVEETIMPEENPIPTLDESDDWLKLKLPEITWRKELLTLIIDEDMIRRFVVFTDNFAQGTLAYEHSPFVLPKAKFTPVTDSAIFQENTQGKDGAIIKQNVWQWDESSSKRFSLYIDLLRSMDSDSLVLWYLEVKPLIDEAYRELGYEDDFTNVLQDAITRVLDMELPKSSMKLVQPSVAYRFADPQLEALPATDKLLLRLGKDNLLVMKSVLLELHEKLAQQENGVH